MSAIPLAETLHNGELLKVYRPELVILPTPEQVDHYAAGMVQQQLETKPDSIFTFPTGSTPIEMYRILVEANLKWDQARIFNLDEYYPIDPENSASYAAFMRHHLIDHINIPPENWNFLNGMAPDPHEEAARYDKLLAQFGRVDKAVLGLGPGTTCHIGFNEDGSLLTSRTRLVPLDPQTIKANIPFFDNPNDLLGTAITQGVANILEALGIVFIIKGRHKAPGVRRTFEGEIGSAAPASFTRLHENVTAILDEEAASMLSPEFRSSI